MKRYINTILVIEKIIRFVRQTNHETKWCDAKGQNENDHTTCAFHHTLLSLVHGTEECATKRVFGVIISYDDVVGK